MGGDRMLENIYDPKPHNITDPTWEYEGIKGDGVPPECIGKHSGVCIIAASAINVYYDYDKAIELLSHHGEYSLLCVNDIGCFIRGNVLAIVTSHPEWVPGWILWRTDPAHPYDKECKNSPLIYSDITSPHVNVVWSGLGNQVGTSGMLACLIGICMGFDKIILCGMPLDWGLPHFFSPYGIKQSPQSIVVNKASWEYARTKLPTFSKKIRSMSGLTREWLGEPTMEWLAEPVWRPETFTKIGEPK